MRINHQRTLRISINGGEKTMRNLELEKEMKDISEEIWQVIGKDKEMPKIESKQGGYSGCYSRSRHTVYYRWNVWRQLTLAGKRMLAIHELWHARGEGHRGSNMFLHAFDILTIEVYKMIYGEDEPYRVMFDFVKKKIDEVIK